ncbi:MAG: hypothetical protein EXR78_08455 [Deltaproteobacteria bacterium]|nr:hypothetical protein [Deltaproteobacteria bacterium]
MIFRGTYDDIEGIHRPYITVQVRAAEGIWIPLPFLIDSGADATFLDVSCLQQRGAASGIVSEQTASGIGGKAPHVQFSTALRFESPEGTKTFGGTVGVFTDPKASDTPVLGRDVLDHFRLIFGGLPRCLNLRNAPPHLRGFHFVVLSLGLKLFHCFEHFMQIRSRNINLL